MSDYKYTSYDLTSTIADVGEIGINDVVMLNGSNIVTAIDQDYKGINPVPSFDVAKGISSTISIDVADIRKGYFNLSSDNVISGKNTYLSAQSFVSANIESEEVAYSKIRDLSVTKSLSADFNNIINTKQDFLSALHSTDQIKRINNIYRIVDEIIVETGIKDNSAMPPYAQLYTSDWGTLVNTYIKSGIITVKADELNIHEGDVISRFISNSDPDVNAVVDVLQAILNRLRIAPYSLDSKIRSIENSIDALEVDLTDHVEEIETKQQNHSNDITSIKSKITNANCNYTLSSSGKLSVITSINQISGKVEVRAKNLTSADVEGLSNYVDAKDTEVKQYIDATYLPLSGGRVVGMLSVDNINVGNSTSSIKFGENDLCTLLKDEISLSVANSANDLSVRLSNDFGFGYDISSNTISARVAGKVLQFSAKKFTEARLIRGVRVSYQDEKPILWLMFPGDIEEQFEEVSVDLAGLTPLYIGTNGVDIQYDGNKFKVSADSTICRRSDILALSTANTISSGHIITALSQSNGKIAYESTKLSTSHVSGLEDYKQIESFAKSLSGNNGVISSLSNSVKTTIENLDYESKEFYGSDSNAGKIKVLTSLSQSDGKIDYGVELLEYTKISGLSNALATKLDNNVDSKLSGNLSVYGNINATQGLNVTSSFTAIGGKTSSSGANGAVAIGRDAVAKDEESFVWSGTHEELSTYNSHGQHTFNINPKNGLSGIYIGNQNFHDTLSAISAEATANADIKTKSLFTGIKDVLSSAGIFGKHLEEITLANVISSIYQLGQLVTRLSNDFN